MIIANVKLSSFQMTELLDLARQRQRAMANTHAGTAGAMLDGSDGPLGSASRWVFSSEMILRWVAISSSAWACRVGVEGRVERRGWPRLQMLLSMQPQQSCPDGPQASMKDTHSVESLAQSGQGCWYNSLFRQ